MSKDELKMATAYFGRLGSWIATMKVELFSCEWTKDNSVFSYLKINGFDVYLETFFEEYMEVESCVNVYLNKEHYLAFGGTLENCFVQISEHVQVPNYPDESATSTSDKQTKSVRTPDRLK